MKVYLKSTSAEDFRIYDIRLDTLVMFLICYILRGEDEIGIDRIISYIIASMSNSDELFGTF